MWKKSTVLELDMGCDARVLQKPYSNQLGAIAANGTDGDYVHVLLETWKDQLDENSLWFTSWEWCDTLRHTELVIPHLCESPSLSVPS